MGSLFNDARECSFVSLFNDATVRAEYDRPPKWGKWKWVALKWCEKRNQMIRSWMMRLWEQSFRCFPNGKVVRSWMMRVARIIKWLITLKWCETRCSLLDDATVSVCVSVSQMGKWFALKWCEVLGHSWMMWEWTLLDDACVKGNWIIQAKRSVKKGSLWVYRLDDDENMWGNRNKFNAWPWTVLV